ncbi:biotin--[acetyl-CoA-carboxylase] ligase [Ramlibacter humi]|uniref:biotin--[biotin carboxyl-carrier protein] ligase n=1 Tax=Ramlibacter humi TaxID=2530451 RepID=A0A4Z0BRL0_9BURK|nr:biotin--[acetyl-CoA-carboxylase] ligase [Ramlibacter humi]TFZ01957.1 biotin--[acetyl-CoA-carboxylase] ligase [Ramlibacter humi]
MRWPAEAVWEAVAPLLPGFTVEVLPELDSTNSELMRRARAGRTEPVLLVAEHQTAGRGRLGRSWESAAGDSLTFSLGLPLAPPDWSGLSLAVGVAVAEALHADIRLKWPNDLWVDDRKLTGILIETAAPVDGGASRYTIVGIGINVAPRAAPAIGLRELQPDATAPGTLLAVAEPVVRTLQAFEQFGFSPFQARFERRDALADRAVRLSDGMAGTAHGVDERGALLVHTAAGMRAVTSAEVSVRPA